MTSLQRSVLRAALVIDERPSDTHNLEALRDKWSASARISLCARAHSVGAQLHLPSLKPFGRPVLQRTPSRLLRDTAARARARPKIYVSTVRVATARAGSAPLVLARLHSGLCELMALIVRARALAQVVMCRSLFEGSCGAPFDTVKRLLAMAKKAAHSLDCCDNALLPRPTSSSSSNQKHHYGRSAN